MVKMGAGGEGKKERKRPNAWEGLARGLPPPKPRVLPLRRSATGGEGGDGDEKEFADPSAHPHTYYFPSLSSLSLILFFFFSFFLSAPRALPRVDFSPR